MTNRRCYIGISHQTKDSLEDYLNMHKIQFGQVITDVFNLNGLIYRLDIDSEAEMSLKLSIPIATCIYLSDNRETT